MQENHELIAFYLTWPGGPCQVKEYEMTSEQNILTGWMAGWLDGWLADCTDCQPVCLNMGWTSVSCFFGHIQLGDVADYQQSDNTYFWKVSHQFSH